MSPKSKIGKEQYGGPGEPSQWGKPPQSKAKPWACPTCGTTVLSGNKRCPTCLYSPPKASIPIQPPLPSPKPYGGQNVSWNNTDNIPYVLEKLAVEIDRLHARLDELERQSLGTCAECDGVSLPGDYLCARHRDAIRN